MKKTIVSSLVLSLIPGLCLGVNDRIYKLMQEKQEKMEKLEKCQGTTKNLKIAGISTLGITAVGIGTNIAEAVVLNDYKSDVQKAKDARDEQQKIKDDREAAQRLNADVPTASKQADKAQDDGKYVVKLDFKDESLSYTDAVKKVLQWGITNGQSFSDCEYRHEDSVDPDADYIMCNNKDSKKWMFKFKPFLDKKAAKDNTDNKEESKKTGENKKSSAGDEKGKEADNKSKSDDATEETVPSMKEQREMWLASLREKAKPAFDIDSMSPKRALEAVAGWGNANNITLKNCDVYYSDNTVECDDDFEFKFAKIINVTEGLKEEAKTAYEDQRMTPNNAREQVIEWGRNNELELKNCAPQENSDVVTCDGGFRFNFQKILWTREWDMGDTPEITEFNEAIALIQQQWPQIADEDSFTCSSASGKVVYCFSQDGNYRIMHKFKFGYDVPSKRY